MSPRQVGPAKEVPEEGGIVVRGASCGGWALAVVP